jgi:hypothetical protein
VTGAALGTAISLAATGVVYALASPIRVRTGWQRAGSRLSLVEVVVTVVIAVVLGALALWAASDRIARPVRAWTMAAAVVAVVSAMPLWRLEVPTGSKVALTTMHLLTGGAAVLGQRLASWARRGGRPAER